MYRIKAINTANGKSLVMDIPTFDNKDEAQEWATDFFEMFGTPVASFEVIETEE